MQCSAWTRKKKRCPIEADRMETDGSPVCHVHHSTSLFQKQVEAKRQDRAARKKVAKPHRPPPRTVPASPPCPICGYVRRSVTGNCIRCGWAGTQEA